MRYISGTKLDERIIRCDLDLGYKEGRQFGRGKSGGQVRDEHRQDYDPGRGGWGAQAQRLEIERRREVEERYADAQDGPGAVAGGGGDWKESNNVQSVNPLKRGRSPDDEGEGSRLVSTKIKLMVFLPHTGLSRVVQDWTMGTVNACNFVLFFLLYCSFLSLSA